MTFGKRTRIAVGDNMLKIVRTKEEVWNSHLLTHKECDDDMH